MTRSGLAPALEVADAPNEPRGWRGLGKAVVLAAAMGIAATIAIPRAVPQDIVLSPRLTQLIHVLWGVSLLAAGFLAAVFVKSCSAWRRGVEADPAGAGAPTVGRAGDARLLADFAAKSGSVLRRAAVVPAVLVVLWLLNAYVAAARSLNDEGGPSALRLMDFGSLFRFYVPLAAGFYLLVVLVCTFLRRSQSWLGSLGWVPEVSRQGLLAGLSSFFSHA